MTRARLIVLVCLAAVVAAALLIPTMRDEVAWYWTESQGQAGDYMRYLSDWPKGQHVNEARMRYEQRQWAATKRALILQAYQQSLKTNSPDNDPAYRNERRLRRELLFWRQATNANTIISFEDYLRQYPKGQFVAKARTQIEALRRAAPAPNPAAP